MPEVRFDDVLTAVIPQADTALPIDRRFLEVCVTDSVEVCGCVSDIPVLVGATTIANDVLVQFAEQKPDRHLRLVIRLTGIRKHYKGMRFPDRSREQFEANERFIKSAYHHG